MKYLTLTAVLFFFSCRQQTTGDLYKCTDETVYDLGHSIRYQDIYGIKDYEEFARSNHLEQSCGDGTIKSIFELIDLLSSAQSELDQKVGGNDINGRLIAACEVRTGGEVLMMIKFTQQLADLLDGLSSLDSQTEFHDEMIKRLHDDVRVLTSEQYQGQSIYDRKVLEIYLDLNNAKMKLLFSETIMFEMLKFHGIC